MNRLRQALGFAEIAARHIGSNAVETGVVQQVLCLRTELHVDSFRKLERLVQAGVQLLEARAMEITPAEASKSFIQRPARRISRIYKE